ETAREPPANAGCEVPLQLRMRNDDGHRRAHIPTDGVTGVLERLRGRSKHDAGALGSAIVGHGIDIACVALALAHAARFSKCCRISTPRESPSRWNHGTLTR